MTLLNRILPTEHFLESPRVLCIHLAKEEAERTLAFFTGKLYVNIRVLFVFNPKPVLLDNFIPVSAVKFPLVSSLNFGTYVNSSCESFGLSLAIFTCFSKLFPTPLSWTLSTWWQRFISYIHLEPVIKTREYFSCLFFRKAVFSVRRGFVASGNLSYLLVRPKAAQAHGEHTPTSGWWARLCPLCLGIFITPRFQRRVGWPWCVVRPLQILLEEHKQERWYFCSLLFPSCDPASPDCHKGLIVSGSHDHHAGHSLPVNPSPKLCA